MSYIKQLLMEEIEKSPLHGSFDESIPYLEFAFKRYGPNMMPQRPPKNKYEPLAEKLRQVANAADRVERARQIIEQAEKNNPNHLVF